MPGKSIRYDILCQTESRKRFIVEMQKAGQPKFIDRATFYVSRGIAEQGYRGKKGEEKEWDYALEPVVGVFICHSNIRGLDRRPIVRASTLDEDTFKPVGVKTRYIFVQLASFEKKESECESLDEKWIYNIKNMGIRQEVAFKQQNDAYCTAISEGIEEGIEEGLTKGRAKEKHEIVRNMLSGGMSTEMISSFTGIRAVGTSRPYQSQGRR